MKTTVIIPNYNGMAYLDNCIQSLQACKQYSDFETIIVDNGSTDGSEKLATAYQESGIAKAICFDTNTGFTGAVNAGIEATATEYVLLLNNDTEVTPEFVTKLEAFMDSHPKAFSASSKMMALKQPDIIDDCGDEYCALGWALGRGKGKHKDAAAYQKDCQVFAACAGAAIYRKAVFDEMGAFDDNHFAYLEDIDVGYRARIHGYENWFCHDAIVYHAGSAVSGSKHNAFKVTLSSKNNVYLAYKNMPLLQLILNLPFLLLGYLIKTIFFARKGLAGTYLKGLCNGVKLCASANGRAHKVKFQSKHLGHYCKIQLLLWKNLFEMI